MRRIGINLLYLVPGAVGGSEIYAHRLLEAIRAERPSLELVVYCAPEAVDSLSCAGWAGGSVAFRPAPGSSRLKPLRALVEQTWLPWRAAFDRVELVHSLGTTAPVIGRVPSVVTVLDLIYHHVPDTFPAPARIGLGVIVPRAARHAAAVLSISEFGKRDLISVYAIDAAKITPVHLGPGSPPSADFTSEPALRQRLGVPSDAAIVLCVSAAIAHKNLPRLIDAFAAVAAARDAVLVLVGHGGGTGAAQLRAHAAAAGVADKVVLTGWIEQADLEGLYRCARVFAYPSLLEGFGLPILEAMDRGVPVACSNASSLPEIGGDAAEFYDPLDTSAIASAITRLLDDGPRRAELAARGHERVKAFSWERCARETLAVYERVAAGGVRSAASESSRGS